MAPFFWQSKRLSLFQNTPDVDCQSLALVVLSLTDASTRFGMATPFRKHLMPESRVTNRLPLLQDSEDNRLATTVGKVNQAAALSIDLQPDHT